MHRYYYKEAFYTCKGHAMRLASPQKTSVVISDAHRICNVNVKDELVCIKPTVSNLKTIET